MKNKNILVIKDTFVTAQLLFKFLEDKYNMMLAYDGDNGLMFYRGMKPDLILLDLGLPDMTGYDICHTIRHVHKDYTTPIIIVTCNESKEAKIKAKDYGANDYIVSPFYKDEIINKVKEALNERG